MFKNSWRLRQLWLNHSKTMGGLRMMTFHEFEAAIEEFVRSVEQPDPKDTDAEQAAMD